MSKQKIILDYVIKSSPKILFDLLSTPSGLALWFADHVSSSEKGFEKIFSFFWNGAEETAVLLEQEENVFIQFQMEDAEEGEYLEFRIEKSPITGDTILIITDFAYEEDIEDQKQLWQAQVKSLISKVGGSN
jgi:uncharacterized protein YndB with AHSA1/START domain